MLVNVSPMNIEAFKHSVLDPLLLENLNFTMHFCKIYRYTLDPVVRSIGRGFKTRVEKMTVRRKLAEG